MTRTIALTALTAVMAAADEAPQPKTVYFFFAQSTDPRDVALGLKKLGELRGLRTRPVLLVTDLQTLEADLLELYEHVRPGELALFDPEGLEAARRFGVARVPCFVYLDRRAHRVFGAAADLKELTRCSK